MFKKSLPIFLICLVLVGACVGLGYIWKDKNEAQTEAEGEMTEKPGNQSTKPQQAENTQEDDTEKEDVQTDIPEEEPVLSEFSTEGENDPDRNINLGIACEKLNGTVIPAGGSISFNETIGPCTAEEGYVEAKILVNGGAGTAKDIGGGVCQVATTLFNAALRGNLIISESHRHSAPVTYVPVGMDAMVSDPYYDLVIENPYSEDIVIEAESKESKVLIRLTGPSMNGQKIEIESIVTEEIPIGGTVYKVTDQLEPGVESMTEEGHPGYKTESYKVTYNEKGEEIGRELLSTDEYPAVNPVVEVGKSDFNK